MRYFRNLPTDFQGLTDPCKFVVWSCFSILDYEPFPESFLVKSWEETYGHFQNWICDNLSYRCISNLSDGSISFILPSHNRVKGSSLFYDAPLLELPEQDVDRHETGHWTGGGYHILNQYNIIKQINKLFVREKHYQIMNKLFWIF